MPIVIYVIPIKGQASTNEEIYILVIGDKIPLTLLSKT